MRRTRVPAARRFNQPEIASCSENIQLPPGSTNVMYGPNPFTLSQFRRAPAIAANYQQYRITGVTWRFRPHFDTFVATPDGPTSLRVPQLLYMVDKAMSIPTAGITGAVLRAMGAKPIRFDDKTITVKYRPGVNLTASADTPVSGAETKVMISPWLSTGVNNFSAVWSPSEVFHNGLWFGLEVDLGVPGDGSYEYGVECEVQFEFRKPLVLTAANAAPNLSLIDSVAH